MGMYGWSRKEQDEQRVKPFVIESTRTTATMKKALRLYNEGRVSCISAVGGHLEFEVKNFRNEYHRVNRTRTGDWTAFHRYRGEEKGTNFKSVTRAIHDPCKSAYITACLLWLRGDDRKEVKL